MSLDRTDLVMTAYKGEAARKYDAKRFVTRQGRLFSELEFEQFELALGYLSGAARILELGCGTGRFSEYVASRGYHILATDPSSDMIQIAAQKCSELDNIQFKQEEGGHLSFPDATFDFVFAIRVLNQTRSEEYALRMIGEMIRVTRSGGLVLLEFVNRERPFAKRNKSVRLSFGQIERIAHTRDCEIVRRSGVLVFSQSLLNRIPGRLTRLWGLVERGAARIFWRWASRGYIVLRKR